MMKLSDEEVDGFAGCADMKTAGMIRISFGIYNTEEEIDKFLEILPDIMAASSVRDYYIEINKDRTVPEEELKDIEASIRLDY